ncbi:hypothetical protein BJ165DRAFT_896332 [Panaeolus papilionaceus]|nr:hypothetical protein BJ165DRAFT_896332 [Panaeolus papilionaceus]
MIATLVPCDLNRRVRHEPKSAHSAQMTDDICYQAPTIDLFLLRSPILDEAVQSNRGFCVQSIRRGKELFLPNANVVSNSHHLSVDASHRPRTRALLYPNNNMTTYFSMKPITGNRVPCYGKASSPVSTHPPPPPPPGSGSTSTKGNKNS